MTTAQLVTTPNRKVRLVRTGPRPVSQARIEIATDTLRLDNADVIAVACREAKIPFYVACALFLKESKGKNVWGHDAGGALSGYERPVTKQGFLIFYWMVVEHGMTSNGVGPGQITYAGSLKNGRRDGGYFRLMEEQNLKPWDVHDNMLFSLTVLNNHYIANESWVTAGRLYNGALAYGQDLAKQIDFCKSILSVR